MKITSTHTFFNTKVALSILALCGLMSIFARPVQAQTSNMPFPVGSQPSATLSAPRGIPARLNAGYQERQRNARNNESFRNTMLESRVASPSTDRGRYMAILEQQNTALNNLKQIRGRIGSRLDKVQAQGTDVSAARNLLTIADTKLALAEVSVNNFSLRTMATSTAAIGAAKNALEDVVTNMSSQLISNE